MSKRITPFIVLPKDFTEWDIYRNPVKKSVFIHLIIKANWEEKEWKDMKILRGQLVTSRSRLAKELGLKDSQVRSQLSSLQSDNLIDISTTQNYSLITVKNYDRFQPNSQRNSQQLDSKPPAKAPQLNNNKIINNKKINNYITSKTCNEIVDVFNRTCASLPKVKLVNNARIKAINSRYKESGSREDPMNFFEDFFRAVEGSDFLAGRRGDFKASFDWIMKPNNFAKIIEGNYANREEVQHDKYNASFEI